MVTDKSFSQPDSDYWSSYDNNNYYRSDIESTSLSTEILYILFHDRFSRGAAFHHTSKQSQTNWSPLISFNGSYQKLNSKEPLFPEDLLTERESENGYGDSKVSANIGGGIAGLWVLPYDFQLGREFIFNIGKYYNLDHASQKMGNSLSLSSKVSIGKHTTDYALGFKAGFISNIYYNNHFSTAQDYTFRELYYAKHFH